MYKKVNFSHLSSWYDRHLSSSLTAMLSPLSPDCEGDRHLVFTVDRLCFKSFFKYCPWFSDYDLQGYL